MSNIKTEFKKKRFKQNIYDKVKKQCQKVFQPCDQTWNSRYELHEKWTT
jgi:hypothetical protein